MLSQEQNETTSEHNVPSTSRGHMFFRAIEFQLTDLLVDNWSIKRIGGGFSSNTRGTYLTNILPT